MLLITHDNIMVKRGQLGGAGRQRGPGVSDDSAAVLLIVTITTYMALCSRVNME